MTRRLTSLGCTLYLLLASTAVAADFSGSVVSVLDGDTIEVLHYTSPERIRLSGIDCLRKAKPSATERSRLHQR